MIRLPQKILCLDWDKRALRMVVSRDSGGKMQLEDAHSHRIPANVDIDDAQSMGAFIAQMQKRHRWHHKRVIVDVPRERAVINTITLPPTPLDELASAVRFQALKELPFPLDEAVIDYAIITREGRTVTEVLLAAIRTETLDKLLETCEAAGLTPARIGLRPYANVVSVGQVYHAADKRVLYVDVGPTLTEIDVVHAGKLAFSRSANVNVPIPRLPEVDEIEDSRISSKAELEEVAVSEEAFDESERALTVEITRTMQAYRATDQDVVIDQIIVGGGTGIEPQLLRSVSKRFGVSSELFNPIEALGVTPDDSVKLRSFSAVLGLAWGLSKEGELEVDFLNPKKPIPRGQARNRRIRLAAGVVAVLLIAASSLGVVRYRAGAEELRGIRSEIAKLQKDVQKKLKLRNKCEEFGEWAAEAVWLDELLPISQQAINPGKDMRVSKTTFSRGNGTISLSLLSRDDKIPDRFVNALHKVASGARYSVKQKQLREGIDEKFGFNVDINIDLLEFQEHLRGADARQKTRKKRVSMKDIIKQSKLESGGRS